MVNCIDTSRVDFLEQLKTATQAAVKEFMLPTRIQSANDEPTCREADIYLMRLNDSKSAFKKAPYIIHQLITGRDIQPEGQPVRSSVQVRSIFCVYSDDEQEGGLMLLGLAERVRIYLLRHTVIGERYQLDLEQGADFIAYPDDTAPYFAGEMVTTWKIPTIEREVRQWL